MPRVFAILALMLCLGSAYAAVAPCDDNCDDEIGGDVCPPMCPTCRCVTHQGSASTAPMPVVVTLVLPSTTVHFERPQSLVPSPDPKELLHVPRSSR